MYLSFDIITISWIISSSPFAKCAYLLLCTACARKTAAEAKAYGVVPWRKLSPKQKLNSLSVSDDALICHPSWVQHFNSTFKKFCVVVAYIQQPTFGKVQDLMVLPDGEVVFYVTMYKTLHFDTTTMHT